MDFCADRAKSDRMPRPVRTPERRKKFSHRRSDFPPLRRASRGTSFWTEQWAGELETEEMIALGVGNADRFGPESSRGARQSGAVG